MAAIVSGNDHELALEEALQRIGGEPGTDEEDDEELSVVEYDEEEQRPPAPTASVVSGPAPPETTTNGDNGGGGGGRYEVPEPYIGTPSNSVPLKEVLGEYRSFMLFRRFLKDQCITRNLQFWLACEYYHTQMPLEGIKAAKAIYCRFLKSSAPLHVSILEATKRKICTIVQLGSPPGYTLFLEAQQEVYSQMEVNELQQFLCSDSFSECSQFPTRGPTQNMYGSVSGDIGFQPSRYRNGGSLHSSDDSTSVTSFASEDVGSTHTQVLCLPHHTKSVYTPRNAHSDTEHSSHPRRHQYAGPTTHISRNKVLTQNQFYEIVCEKLSAVQRDRTAMKQRARNIARIEGKSYEDIMSIDWFDTPEAIKYVCFDDEGTTAGTDDALHSPPLSLPPPHKQSSVGKRATVESSDTPPSTTSGATSHHLISFGLKEIQEALRDLDIASQVRQKRSSTLMSSSASSYISDSGVGESNLPSSGSGGPGPSSGHNSRLSNRVHAYLQNQQRVTSQQSEREAQAQLVATMLMNNSVPSDELNPYHNNGRRSYANYPGAYSSDDSSSCFTATSHSSNSEFFVPRRPHPLYGDSNDESRQQSHHHSRYPPGMRRLTPSNRRPPSSRYLPQQATPNQSPQQQLSTSNRAISPSVHPSSKSSSDTLLVAYSWEGKTYANKLQVSCLTLGEFKEKMFKRKGQYRFFFKSFCEELNDVILEEISDNSVTLPLHEGKIVGQVEGITD